MGGGDRQDSQSQTPQGGLEPFRQRQPAKAAVGGVDAPSKSDCHQTSQHPQGQIDYKLAIVMEAKRGHGEGGKVPQKLSGNQDRDDGCDHDMS